MTLEGIYAFTVVFFLISPARRSRVKGTTYMRIEMCDHRTHMFHLQSARTVTWSTFPKLGRV